MQIEVARYSELSTARDVAKQMIDEAAEAARQRYITPGAGQAAEYEMVRLEAEQFADDPLGHRFPLLQSDVDAGYAKTLTEAAERVRKASANWTAAALAIRSCRLRWKRTIDVTESHGAVFQERTKALKELELL